MRERRARPGPVLVAVLVAAPIIISLVSPRALAEDKGPNCGPGKSNQTFASPLFTSQKRGMVARVVCTLRDKRAQTSYGESCGQTQLSCCCLDCICSARHAPSSTSALSHLMLAARPQFGVRRDSGAVCRLGICSAYDDRLQALHQLLCNGWCDSRLRSQYGRFPSGR